MDHKKFTMPEAIDKVLNGEPLEKHREAVAETITNAEACKIPMFMLDILYGETDSADNVVRQAIKHLDRIRVAEAAACALHALALQPPGLLHTDEDLRKLRKAASMTAIGTDLAQASKLIERLSNWMLTQTVD